MRNANSLITTPDDSAKIDLMGGTAAVAKVFDISEAAISQWRTHGIPKARRMYLELAYPDLFASKAA
jgi:hypothetical protein